MGYNDVEDFFEHIGLNPYSEEDYLEHYGKKGMRWGHKTGRSESDISVRSSRKEMRQIRKSGLKAIKSASKAKSPAERKAAADKYQKEVVDRMSSPEFKAKYAKANTMTKGDVVAHLIAFGPLGVLSAKASSDNKAVARAFGAEKELNAAKQVLKDLNSL